MLVPHRLPLVGRHGGVDHRALWRRNTDCELRQNGGVRAAAVSRGPVDPEAARRPGDRPPALLDVARLNFPSDSSFCHKKKAQMASIQVKLESVKRCQWS